MQSVSEDTPLWDEDDALDEAEAEAKAKGKPKKKAAKPAAKPSAKAAAGAVVPKVKKAAAKAAKSGAAAAKVTHDEESAIRKPVTDCQLAAAPMCDGKTQDSVAEVSSGAHPWALTSSQAVAAKLKKSTDITADKIVEDEPLEFGAAPDEDEEEAADRLPGEVTWEREALVSTKSECTPTPPYPSTEPQNRDLSS